MLFAFGQLGEVPDHIPVHEHTLHKFIILVDKPEEKQNHHNKNRKKLTEGNHYNSHPGMFSFAPYGVQPLLDVLPSRRTEEWQTFNIKNSFHQNSSRAGHSNRTTQVGPETTAQHSTTHNSKAASTSHLSELNYNREIASASLSWGIAYYSLPHSLPPHFGMCNRLAKPTFTAGRYLANKAWAAPPLPTA